VQHGWGGIPGRPSMAEIVKMGRPQAKVGSRSVASSTAMPAIGDSVISNIPNLAPKEYNKTVFASEVGHGAADKLPNGAVEVRSVPKMLPHLICYLQQREQMLKPFPRVLTRKVHQRQMPMKMTLKKTQIWKRAIQKA